MNDWSNLAMNEAHLVYRFPIPRKGIYSTSVKLLWVLSIFKEWLTRGPYIPT